METENRITVITLHNLNATCQKTMTSIKFICNTENTSPRFHHQPDCKCQEKAEARGRVLGGPRASPDHSATGSAIGSDRKDLKTNRELRLRGRRREAPHCASAEWPWRVGAHPMAMPTNTSIYGENDNQRGWACLALRFLSVSSSVHPVEPRLSNDDKEESVFHNGEMTYKCRQRTAIRMWEKGSLKCK